MAKENFWRTYLGVRRNIYRGADVTVSSITQTGAQYRKNISRGKRTQEDADLLTTFFRSLKEKTSGVALVQKEDARESIEAEFG